MADPIIPQKPQQTPDEQPLMTPVVPAPLPINGQPSGLAAKKTYKKRIIRIIWGSVALIAATFAAASIWYAVQLLPASTDTQKRVLITIESGSGPTQISALLEEKQVIRSSTAFDIYTRISGVRDNLQAGTYRLAPSDDVAEIVRHLTNGLTDTFNLTFFPGATLVDATNKPVNQKLDVTTVLTSAGYSQAEITIAFAKSYNHPLLAGKPESADLEGYVYGETYNFNSGATVEDILKRTFDEMYAVVTDNDLIAKYKARGLNLYQAITLASIVQREVSTESDRRAVAAVFFNRIDAGMTLGSDVTFIYAANKLGVAPISTLDSPYNTRINIGLPPGPIASPGQTSLLAVASPDANDFLFFVAGDDGTTYFARTNAEHLQNVARYCTVECAKP